MGDTDGAIEPMAMAVAAADPGHRAWYRPQLGDLHFSRGDVRVAARLQDEALVLAPNSHAAPAGSARAHAAMGETERAVALYSRSLQLLPSPLVAEELGFLGVITIWFIYRIARGWIALKDGRPMYV